MEKPCLFKPAMSIDAGVQLSAHVCTKTVTNEAKYIFPGKDLNGLIAIITMQRCKYEMVNFGVDVDKAKDLLLENFLVIANEICSTLESHGYWADYIDPCSGLPMKTRDSNKVYSEVYGAETMLGYRSQNAGCCKVLLHPQWGSAVYPATIFTTAPENIICDVLQQLCTKPLSCDQ